ncbi:hypothetical protein EUX98_g4224 [Antrodiella citrinella]|uniref:Uncharacterized protein n=1 Tax=Antrodiella citrinella TaxID=2447956 RepID=A0A4S4N2J0_9APHY|nr:hypothetical protein EUX98_g4224 [Antrodiella citrinella]
MSGPPAQPGFAQIPLPAGMTLEQYMTLQGQAVTIAITVAVVTSILLWDYFSLLGDEIASYRGDGGKWWQSPGTWSFIILRYAGIIAMVPSLFFTSVQSAHCQAAVSLSQVGAILAVAASGAIFSFRVSALWNGNSVVRGVVALMYCLMISCWIAVGSKYAADQGPATPFGSNCQMRPIVSWAPISFASTVAFDTVVLFLTLAKIHVNFSVTSSQVGQQIYRDNVMYFLITTVTNVVVLAIESLGSEHAMIKPTAVPFSTLMTVTMGSRVYLNLKLMNSRKAAGDSRSPFASLNMVSRNRPDGGPRTPSLYVMDATQVTSHRDDTSYLEDPVFAKPKHANGSQQSVV